MKKLFHFSIEDSSSAGEIRRALTPAAEELGFDEVKATEVSIVVNELVTNILKHAQRGELICVTDDESLSILAIDKGPGIANILEALRDGYSTHGTAGNGLGAVKRLADEFDIYSVIQKGTVVLAKFNLANLKTGLKCFGFSLPLKGETVSGDGWASKNGDTFKLLVCDGLGHGLQAHSATRVAIETFESSENLSAIADVNLIHLALRSTRGAAISVLHYDHQKQLVEYCGLGNIVGSINSPGSSKRLVSYNGTAGLQMRKIQSLPYPFEDSSTLILHSDGMATHWNLTDYPGLIMKHPLIIAGVLYRDFTRGNDDVTVIVGKYYP